MISLCESEAATIPLPARPVFKELLEKKRMELDRARTRARTARELAQVLALLQSGPLTLRQISEATCLTDSTARHRAHQVGGVWDGEGHWVLEAGKSRVGV